MINGRGDAGKISYAKQNSLTQFLIIFAFWYQNGWNNRNPLLLLCSTEAFRVPVQSQRLLWNHFFGFQQPKNWLSVRRTGSRVAPAMCWSRTMKEPSQAEDQLTTAYDCHFFQKTEPVCLVLICQRETKHQIFTIDSKWSNSSPRTVHVWMPM